MTTRGKPFFKPCLKPLQTISGPRFYGNEALPEKVPAGGLLILRDGDPGEPETILSPLSYYWQHLASLEVFVRGRSDAARRAYGCAVSK